MPTAEYLRHKAAFSDFSTRNVDPRAPTNLATRARRQRALMDMDAAAQAKVEEEAEAMKSIIRRDRVAQSLYLGQQRIAETKRMHDEQIRINQEKAEQEAKLFPLKKEELKNKAAAAVALERARINDSNFKEWQRGQQAEDAYNFSTYVRKSGHRVGSPGYLEAVVEAKQLFPGVPSEIFDDTWKTTGSRRTPEEVQASIAAARAANPNATITATEKGTTITDKPNKTELDRLKSQLSSLELAQMKAEDEDREQYEEPLRILREKIAAQGTTAAPDQAKPKAVKQNGVTYYLQPDGSYK